MDAKSVRMDAKDWARVSKLAEKHLRDNGEMARVLILKGLVYFEKEKM
jgi:hypothetical protein